MDRRLPRLEDLPAEQARVAQLAPRLWQPDGPVAVAGCFVAYERGVEGPGAEGDPAWAAATVVAPDGSARTAVVEGRAGAPYVPGLLIAREGPLLLAALDALAGRPDVLLVDGTGRDHPRRAGLAVHLGALLDLPTIGVTHRPLVADRAPPSITRRGETVGIRYGSDLVAAWVCTGVGLRPLVAHAGWRTSVETAAALVVASATAARAPEPLRRAREAARRARAGQPPP